MLRDVLRPRGRVGAAERRSRKREAGRRPSHRPDVHRSKRADGAACGSGSAPTAPIEIRPHR
jgi:hypothetical protein